MARGRRGGGRGGSWGLALALALAWGAVLAALALGGAVYARVLDLYPEAVAAVGGTGNLSVGHGYMIVEDFLVYDNTSGGLASTYLDTVAVGYRLFYSIDNGTYTVYIYFNDTGYFEGTGSATGNWSDNQTTQYLVGRLPDRYPQGDWVYVVTQVQKEGG